MNNNSFVKDPNNVEWFGVDWTERLAGDDLAEVDTIDTSAWIVPAGLTQVAVMTTDNKTGVKLSGGTVGNTYRVTNRIVTAVNGETLDGTIEITIVEE